MINRIVGASRNEPATKIPRIQDATLSKQDKGMIIAKTLANPFSLYKVVSISEKPVSFETFKEGDPDVILTRGIYTITYIPESRKKSRPFVISQDLIKGAFTVWDWPHFCRCCWLIPELGWMYRNTNICKELFGIAKCHPGLGIQFTIDYPRYAKKIIEAARAEGIDIDNRPFVSYHCSFKDFDDKYSTKQVSKNRTIHDYKAEFESALNKEE